MARLTIKQQAQKALEKAKLQEAAKAKPIKMLAPGVTGQAITGVRRW